MKTNKLGITMERARWPLYLSIDIDNQNFLFYLSIETNNWTSFITLLVPNNKIMFSGKEAILGINTLTFMS